ncbi:magnesium/cobalt transporter CorA [Geobacter sp. SVR]|uniref:magnesium/cobalt transporter CorA n=1 Tax=Geobacter sp. SVR TaxID=2495594 RepID=UPI00143EF6E0|nr:magnesium/cobalt transporter CorA [Geobacter sp. SVR]BCS54502.1 magnesium transport protein CorA [Geobacter sp. SVR]GCF87102.1 magnesium transport protein CorA [Geobacter sp. SVR]
MANSRRFLKKRSVKTGLPPGTLVHIGEQRREAPRLDLFSYSPAEVEERPCQGLAQCLPHVGRAAVTWINVEGVHDIEVIRTLGEHFGFHPLVLEDIVNTVQRPKIEDYDEYLFMVLRMLRPSQGESFTSEQISIILGPNYLLTFQEGIRGDVFDAVRDRIRSGKGRIRAMGADYLAYTLVDSIVDGYFNVLEVMGERIVNAEEELTLTAGRTTLHLISDMKKEIIFLRKAVWPLREAISFLERGDSRLLDNATRVYFRDVYDHTVQVIDTVETYRDLLSGMLDLYLSSVSNRTNEVMKFLTVIGTIFLPLTFLVGVYGMNFKHMPELEWHYGYPALWFVMLLSSIAMILYFKRKRWL